MSPGLDRPPGTPGDYRNRAVKSSGWVSISVGVSKILDVVQTVALAKILTPEDFGQAAIAILIVAGAEVFSETGIEAVLVQKKNLDRKTLDTAWVLLLVRGLVTCALLLAVAKTVAGFFQNQASAAMIRVASAGLLVSGFTNVGLILLRRELDFKRDTIAQVFAAVSSAVFTILFALLLRNAWAIIAGFLIRRLFLVIVSYIVHPHRPRMQFCKQSMVQALNFGKYVFGTRVAMFLINKSDQAFIARLLGSSALGYYSLAYSISNFPANFAAQMVIPLNLSLYSRLQDDFHALRAAYLKITQLLTLLLFPAICLILILSKEIVLVVFGPKWLPMMPALRILSIYALVSVLGHAGGSILVAIGKPKLETLLVLLRLSVMAILLVPLTMHFGIAGTAAAVLAALAFAFIPSLIIYCRLIGISPKLWVLSLKAPAAGCIFMATVLICCKHLLNTIGWVSLLANLSIALFAYISVVLVLDKNLRKDLHSLTLDLMR